MRLLTTVLLLLTTGCMVADAESIPLACHERTSAVKKRLEDRWLPTVCFAGATIEEAIEFVSGHLNSSEMNEDSVGLKWTNLVLYNNSLSDTSITLDLKDVPASEALRYITELAGFRVEYEANAMVIRPKTNPHPEVVTKRYKLTPKFAADPARTANPAAAMRTAGLSFPESATATYNPKISELTVRADESQFEMVELWLVHLEAWQPPTTATLPKEAQRAAKLRIPMLSLAGATPEEVLPFLIAEARKADPTGRGINLRMKPIHSVVTLDLRDIPLLDALRYIALLSGSTLDATDTTLTLAPRP